MRVVAVYAVGAWLILQIAEVTFEPMGFPAWVMRALIIAVVVGFPLVFFLAWIIRIEPEGLMFDLPLWRGDHPERTEQKTDFVVVGALGILLLDIVLFFLFVLIGATFLFYEIFRKKKCL